MTIRNWAAQAAIGAVFALAGGGAQAASIVRVSVADFTADAGLITFSNTGDSNPVYTPADYGGGAGAPTVTTGGFFLGQSLSGNPSVDCPAAAASACVVGNPTGPLTFDPNSPATFIVGDGATPTSPVLSGSPTFNGPIAVLFSVDLAGVGFDAGFFDAVGSTGITAFARDGTLLGTVVNIGTGIEFLGLVTDDGSERIAGVFLDLVGSEPAGFAIDNLRFGRAGQVAPPGAVPEPGTLGLLGCAFVGIALMRRRRTAPLG